MKMSFRNIIIVSVLFTNVILFSLLFLGFNSFYYKNTKQKFMEENAYSANVAGELINKEIDQLVYFSSTMATNEMLKTSFKGKFVFIDSTLDNPVRISDISKLLFKRIISDLRLKAIGTNFEETIRRDVEIYGSDFEYLSGTTKRAVKTSEKRNLELCLGPKGNASTKFGSVDNENNEIILKGIAPIDNGEKFGVVVFREKIDSNFLKEIKKVVNKEVILLKDDTILTSTLFNGTQIVENTKIKKILDKNNNEIFETKINGKEMIFNVMPIENKFNEKVAYYAVGFYKADVDKIFSESSKFFFIFAAVLSIIVLGIFYILLSVLFRPFKQIMEGIIRFGSGDYSQKISVKSMGELKLMVSKINDLSTAVEKREHELKDKNDKLIEMDKLKDNFLANTSHELRTPINGIIGLSESLMDGVTGPLSEKTIFNLEMITSSGKRLLNLVNDILDFSKMNNKALLVNKKNTNLSKIAVSVVSISKGLVGDKNIQLVNNIPRDFPFVIGDENRLQQILYNLLGNAVKFTDEGTIVLDAEIKDNAAVISVSDTGIGIVKENFEKIFNSFEQIESSDNRQYGGTGLGLSITKKLVEILDGKIWVESEINKGSKFIFTLPVTDEIPNEDDSEIVTSNILPIKESFETLNVEEVEKVRENSNTEKFKVLVVDDEPVNLQVMVNHFSFTDIELDVAANGMEALKKIENTKYDLIMLDIMMPKMSGYDVLGVLRTKYSPLEMPILMISAKNQTQDIVTGFDKGANDYLVKPVEKKEMLARVHTLLHLKKSSMELADKIKELKESQEKLIRSEKLATVGELAGSITHEIKNPLGAIITNAQLLRIDLEDLRKEDNKNKDLLDSIEEEVDIIELASKQAKTIIMNMLDYTRVDKDEQTILDFSSVMDSAVLLVKKELMNSKVEIKMASEKGLYMKGNAGELTQVLLNFILNSRDAIVEKDKLPGLIKISAERDSNKIVLKIEDNGTGISNENKEKIFEAFFTTKPKGKGTGLGMSISQNILKKYNAEVSFESEYGEGTSFTIKFDLQSI